MNQNWRLISLARKANIKIPKDYKCKNGVNCPVDLELEIDVPELAPTMTDIPQTQVTIPNSSDGQINIPTSATTQQLQQQAPAPVQIPNVGFTEDELAAMLPKGTNYVICEGDNCKDKKIKSTKFTTKFQQCPNCNNNSVPKNSQYCPACGVDQPEDDDDYWQGSDIEIPKDEEEDGD